MTRTEAIIWIVVIVAMLAAIAGLMDGFNTGCTWWGR